ncbi:tryptophan synthase beta subunit-like PLP-dependent enzyme [Glomus cerebriforme]|uniref:threonine synthase n=1 Tax=Glomus cerebriforme TaxID=658196 RepID=A0A397TEC1_9GLOM|nr:tryptophan synthase beta subunit-like PLP-dependent enzyme [Glomus cerebriforme]
MKYRSTRGSPKLLSFSEAVLVGLAEDGGLFIPTNIPSLPENWRKDWSDLTFNSLALEIFSLYIPTEEISREELKQLIDNSYSKFNSNDITPLKKIRENLYILELFHGPTFAFKDVALQFLGNLFEYLLEKKNKEKKEKEKITILGATSGDTGSAAIYGLRGKKNISVFILHPRGKVSPVQEAQMTTVLDKNIHNLAVEGTFDDCQDIVKNLFADRSFNEKHHLGAINSINWARILAQIVYYYHSYFQILSSLNITAESKELKGIYFQYCVPTGNFGDILAGYYAKKMGLPISKLVVSTNSNDILDRFFKSGRYERSKGENGLIVKETLSPAMDIAISSNFERLLWYLAYENISKKDEGKRERSEEEKVKEASNIIKEWMQDVKINKSLVVEKSILDIALCDFKSERVSDQETLDTICKYYAPENKDQNSYIFDPHTAIGVTAADRQNTSPNTYQICLATAHPAKFSQAVEKALENFKEFKFESILPKEFIGLLEREKKVIFVERAEPSSVKQTIENELDIE